MKKVYFIRHGETAANERHVHQGPYEVLSEKGKRQAHAVAEELRALGVDRLLCSSYVRARETATIISEALDLPLTIIDSVTEFKRPSSLYGKPHFSFASFAYMQQLFSHRTDASWDNEGAESMFDIRNRILDAKKEIESMKGERIAIVSHAIFMDMFTQVSCTNRPLKMAEYIQALLLARKLPNTGIIAFDVDTLAPDGTCKWWQQETTINKNSSIGT